MVMSIERLLKAAVLALCLPSAACTRATALLRRTAGGSVGATLLPLRVAEAMEDCQHVICLSSSLATAERAAAEWRACSTVEWDARVARRGVLTPASSTAARSVCFCSVAFAEKAFGDDVPCDLLVVDTSGTHARATGAAGAERRAAHAGFLRARRRLFLHLEGAAPAAPWPAARIRSPRQLADECVISEAGASCVSMGADAPAASASEGADAAAAWRGPVCRRLLDRAHTLGHPASAQLAISAADVLLTLSVNEARTALAPHLAQPPTPTHERARATPPPPEAPHLAELALAVLYVFCVMHEKR
jgi:hypothetical protein